MAAADPEEQHGETYHISIPLRRTDSVLLCIPVRPRGREGRKPRACRLRALRACLSYHARGSYEPSLSAAAGLPADRDRAAEHAASTRPAPVHTDDGPGAGACVVPVQQQQQPAKDPDPSFKEVHVDVDQLIERVVVQSAELELERSMSPQPVPQPADTGDEAALDSGGGAVVTVAGPERKSSCKGLDTRRSPEPASTRRRPWLLLYCTANVLDPPRRVHPGARRAHSIALPSGRPCSLACAGPACPPHNRHRPHTCGRGVVQPKHWRTSAVPGPADADLTVAGSPEGPAIPAHIAEPQQPGPAGAGPETSPSSTFPSMGSISASQSGSTLADVASAMYITLGSPQSQHAVLAPLEDTAQPDLDDTDADGTYGDNPTPWEPPAPRTPT